MNSDANDETNFPQKLILTNRQVSTLRKAFSNNFSANIELPKTETYAIIQSERYFGKLLGPLVKVGLPSKQYKSMIN